MYKKTIMAATTMLAACMFMPPAPQDKQVALTSPSSRNSRTQQVDPAKLTLGRITSKDALGTCFPIAKIKTKTGLKLRLLTARHVVRDYVEVNTMVEGVQVTELKEVLGAQKVELFKLEKLIFSTTDVKILKDSKDLDSVLLEVSIQEDLDVQVFRLSTGSPEVGRKVWSFGCQAGLIPTFTQGIVCRPAGVDFTSRKETWITSANVIGGASGGPIVDTQTGLVIGVTAALMQTARGFVMIPITHVHLFIDASEILKWLKT